MNTNGYRECHIQPDWLLIYKIDKSELVLTAFRTGSHSDLFWLNLLVSNVEIYRIMSIKSLVIVRLLHWHYSFFMLVCFYAINVLNIADKF